MNINVSSIETYLSKIESEFAVLIDKYINAGPYIVSTLFLKIDNHLEKRDPYKLRFYDLL